MGRAQATRDAIRYYGGKRCVIDNTPKSCEWHHLNDNNTAWRFENIIPLSREYNNYLGFLKKNATTDREPPLWQALKPQNLERKAAEHFDRWNPPLAYGCARLAQFIRRQYVSSPRAEILASACHALYYARHTVAHDLLNDILLVDVQPLIGDYVRSGVPIPPLTKILLLREFAALMVEHYLPKDAAELFQWLDKELKQMGTRIGNNIEQASLIRREAMILGATGASIDEVKARLNDARDLAPGDSNIEASINNTQAWVSVNRGHRKECIDTLEHQVELYETQVFLSGSDEVRPLSITASNVAETFWNYATMISQFKGGGKRAGRAFSNALRLFGLSRTKPYTSVATVSDAYSVLQSLDTNFHFGARNGLGAELSEALERTLNLMRKAT